VRFGEITILVPLQKVLRGYLENPEGFDATKYEENAHLKEKKTV
jgi:hypothetical protein